MWLHSRYWAFESMHTILNILYTLATRCKGLIHRGMLSVVLVVASYAENLFPINAM